MSLLTSPFSVGVVADYILFIREATPPLMIDQFLRAILLWLAHHLKLTIFAFLAYYNNKIIIDPSSTLATCAGIW